MSRTTRRRRPVLVVLAMLVLAGAAALYLWPRPDDGAAAAGSAVDAAPSATAPSTGGPAADTSSAPSTEPSAEPAEDDAAEADPVATEEPAEQTPQPLESSSPAPAGPAAVGVVLTYSGWDPSAGAVVVGGYADVLEDGGTCTLTLTRGDVVLTGESTATADVTTTSCGELRVSDGALTSGPWQAVVSYRSAGYEGQSDAGEVVVP
ncbi:hypothetical protein ACI79C_17155 [Geodermatophilus sp. SYSU D00697]